MQPGYGSERKDDRKEKETVRGARRRLEKAESNGGDGCASTRQSHPPTAAHTCAGVLGRMERRGRRKDDGEINLPLFGSQE